MSDQEALYRQLWDNADRLTAHLNWLSRPRPAEEINNLIKRLQKVNAPIHKRLRALEE